MFQENYNYKKIRVRVDKETGKLLVSVIDELEEGVYRETLVSSGEELVYKLEKQGLETKYLYQTESGEFVEQPEKDTIVFDFKQIMNHVFGISFETYSRFSIEELKKQENKLNGSNAELFENVFKFKFGKAPQIKNLNESILIVGRPCDIKIGNETISAYEFKTIDGKHTFVQVLNGENVETYHKNKFGKYERVEDVEIYPDAISRVFYLDEINAAGTQEFKEFTLSALLLNIQHSKYPEHAGQNQGFGN